MNIFSSFCLGEKIKLNFITTNSRIPMLSHIIFWILLALWLGFNLLTEIRLAMKRSGAVAGEHRSKFIMLLLIITGVSTGIPVSFLGTTLWFEPFNAVRMFSLPLLAVAFMLRVWAVRALNDFFSFDIQKKSTQKVVTTGPYRIIRHPGYLGELLGFLGIALAFNHIPGSLITFLLPMLAFLYRIRLEEKFMYENFPDEYSAYQKKTRKLIPFIW